MTQEQAAQLEAIYKKELTATPFKFNLYGNHGGGSYNPVTYARLRNFDVTNFTTLTLSGL